MLLILLVCLTAIAVGQSVELAKPGSQIDWGPEHDVSGVEMSPSGLVVAISGGDPYIHCAPFTSPKSKRLWIDVSLKSDTGGSAQIFYCTSDQGPSESRSVRFAVPKSKTFQARVVIPRIADKMYLRFDPPGTRGVCRVFSMSVSEAEDIQAPKSIKASFPSKLTGFELSNGNLRIVHSQTSTDFIVESHGVSMAFGNPSSVIGWSDGKKVRWSSLGKADVSFDARAMAMTAKAGPVTVQRWFWPQGNGFGFRVKYIARVNTELFYAPAMMLFAGQDSFGKKKQQGLFCGLEYLEGDEPSSSEKDIKGPESVRRVPLSSRISVPLMAVNGQDRFVALAWDPSPLMSAVFDSPDRIFGSNGHAMGLILPGSTGSERMENSLAAYRGLKLNKGQSVEVRGWILSGKGKTAVDAIKAYLAVAPKPKPLKPMALSAYANLAARGWLDSGVKVDGKYRHAYWPGISSFGPNVSPDAAAYMKWLEPFAGSALATILEEQSVKALSLVEPGRYGIATVSHLPTFGNTLILGGVRESVARSESIAREGIGRIRDDGTQKYVAGQTDYGKTHYADHANGLTGWTLLSALENALFCGDPDLISKAIANLRNARVYRGTVPRGAQTWEVPLHTPDIMASAHLCKAYSLAYEATGDKNFLADAEYWAYTGLPFVYLYNPTSEPVGKYATTAVFGATNWIAPNWMGLPVQWCGAMYADALYAFARHSKNGLWKTIADGIFDSGVQQSFNDDRKDLVGLLPDSYNLAAQSGNPVAINPGTLEALAPNRYGLPPFYSWFEGISAPGRLSVVSHSTSSITVKIEPAFRGPFWVVVSGSRPVVSLKASGNEVAIEQVGKFAVAARLDSATELRVEYRTGLR